MYTVYRFFWCGSGVFLISLLKLSTWWPVPGWKRPQDLKDWQKKQGYHEQITKSHGLTSYQALLLLNLHDDTKPSHFATGGA